MPHSRIVPADVDKKYRWLIVEYATIAQLPESLIREFDLLLEGPDSRPEALGESKDLLGKDLEATLARTRRIVEALARFFGPEHGLNFFKWLGASGWGNDIRLIRLFERWADEADRRKSLKRMKVHGSLAPASPATH